MTVVIGSNHNLISGILSFIIYVCLFAYFCRGFYKEGYRDGAEDTKGRIKEGEDGQEDEV